MLSPDVLYLVAIEQRHDRMKKLARQEYLLSAAPDTRPNLTNRMGGLLRRWGVSLENFGHTHLQPKQCC